jgi:hypothetical protein
MPTFIDIEDVDSVYRLISDLQEKVRSAKDYILVKGNPTDARVPRCR